MSFKFEFKIDYEKLTTLLDSFLKSHSDELTSIMGKCLVLQPSSNDAPPHIPPSPIPPPSSTEQQPQIDHKVDNRPLIGEDIPEDPLQNLFSINQNPTRYKDRNK
jgi:hypothetical protein